MIFFRLIKESFLFAIQALVVNRLRTILSLTGITIGIFAIISVFTIIDSLEMSMRKSIASLGDNIIYVQKWPWDFSDNYPWWKYFNRPEAGIDELAVIQRESKTAEASAFIIETRKTVKYKSSSAENVNMIAASHEYDKVVNFELSEGRYFSENESTAGRNIVILGSSVAEALFPSRTPVGEYIKVMGRKLQIIGIFEKEGESIFGDSHDAAILMPVNFARNMVDIRDDDVGPYIAVKAKSGVSNEELMDELTGIMRSARKLKPLAEDNFALNQTSIISKGFDGMFDAIGMVGWILGGFSILVGGFGIANIMFVSVKERTSIIGIQKSLGAKNYFILLQFLSESVILSLIGGVIGLLIIYAGIFIIGDSFGMTISLSLSNILLGLTLAGLIGVISGFIPAYGASQLDPVEAIRSNF